MAGEFAWRPSREIVEASNYTRFMRDHQIANFDELLKKADADPGWFYDAVIRWFDIRFTKPYAKILDLSKGPAWAQWCVGGETNITLTLLDKHRDTPAEDRIAVSAETEDGKKRRWTYRELDREACRLAGALRELGIGKGDAVGVYMPMIPEVVAAYLGIARLGAIVVPLFSGFGADAIVTRLTDCEAKAVISVDGARRRGQIVPMKEILDQALARTPSVQHVVVAENVGGSAPMTKGRDHRWSDLLAKQPDRIEATPVPADHPVTIVYTSGTTGRPKGTLLSHIGVVTKIGVDFGLHLDFKPTDRLMWISDFGWAVGVLTFTGALMQGGGIVVIEGGPDYPDKGRMWRLAQEHEVTILGTAPTSVRTLMRHGVEEVRKYDLSKIRVTGSTGEPWTEEAWNWFFEHVCRKTAPIVNWSGGTEISGGIIMGTVIHPTKPCAISAACPGMGADILDEQGNSVPPGQVGELVLRVPSIGLTRGLYKDPERYIETYWSMYPNIWRHGDWASRDEDGMWYIHGRSDDTLKISGKRTGPAEIEGLIMGTGKVSEAAAIGIPDPIKGSAVMCVCVPAPGVTPDEKLVAAVEQAVVDGLGRSFRPARVVFVPDLPKTRTMKIMRRVVKALVLGEAPGDLSSLGNPESVEQLKKAVGRA